MKRVAQTVRTVLDRGTHEVDQPGDLEAEVARPGMTVIDSADLFADRREIRIRHRGEFYRLLMTRKGKLILNK